MRFAPFALLVCFACLLVACAASAPRTAPTASNTVQTAPATRLPPGSFVSENYRLALRPAPGWRVLDRAHTREFNESAIAVASARPGGGERYAMVVVGNAAGVPVDELANLAQRTMHLEAARVIARTHRPFAGEDAVNSEIEGMREGMPVHTRVLVFEHQGFGYEIFLWGSSLTEQDARAFLDAFELLPGDVQPEWQYADTVDAIGQGWRVHDRRFESADTGLFVEPGAAWRIIPAPRLSAINVDAEVGLVSRVPEVYLIEIPEHVPAARQARYITAVSVTMRNRLGAPTSDEPLTLSFGSGPPLAMTQFQRNGMRYFYNLRCEGEECVQLLVWHAVGVDDAAHALLEHSPPTLGFLPEPERAALANTLRDASAPVHTVGLGYSLRNGHYVNYDSGVSIQLPRDGGWRTRAGSEARSVQQNIGLFMQSRKLGLTGLLMSEPLPAGMGEREYHASVRRLLAVGAAQTPLPVHAGHIAGLASEGDAELDPGRFRYHVVTAVRGATAFRLAVWGFVEDVIAAHDALDALAAGLDVATAPLPPTERDGDRFIDHQFGYALRVPNDWQPEDLTAHETRGLSRIQSWRHGEEAIVVLALEDLPQSNRSLREVLTDGIRERMPNVPLGAEWEPATLAGRPGTRLNWTAEGAQIEVTITDIGSTGYGLMTVRPLRSPESHVAQTFELLE